MLVGGKKYPKRHSFLSAGFLCYSLLCQDDHHGGGDGDGDFEYYDDTAFDDHDAVYGDKNRSC